MKKPPSSQDYGMSHCGIQKSVSPAAHAAVHQILKAAYRRHTRGRIAQAAMLACLGR